MKTLGGLLLALALPAAGPVENSPAPGSPPQNSPAPASPVQFYAQLIRGTDQDGPQPASWRPVGPKLSQRLCPKFRWKNYWEVTRESIQVKPGRPTRARLNADREVEIELRDAQNSEIRIYHKGVLTSRSRQSLQTPMSIIGGARENDESWFVVVRLDRPTTD